MRENASAHEYLDIETKHFPIPASKVKGHVINTDWKIEIHDGFVAISRNKNEKEIIHQ